MRHSYLLPMSWLTFTFMFGIGNAQTLGFSVSVTNTLLLEPELTLSDLDLGNSELSLRLAGGVSGPLEFGVSARETQSFGPLGNSTFYSEGAFREADFKLVMGAEGVIATVAGKANLSLSTLQPGMLDIAEIYSVNPNSFFRAEVSRAFKAELGLSASYRLNRTFILTAEPDFYYTDKAGTGVSLKMNARFVRLVDRDDGYVYLNGQLSALDNDYAALGAGYDLNRRGLPDLQGRFWLGLSAGGVKPGVGLELSQNFRNLGTRYSLNLNAEPFRADVLPYRAALRFAQSFGQSELQVEAYGTLKNEFDAPVFTSKLGYLWTF